MTRSSKLLSGMYHIPPMRRAMRLLTAAFTMAALAPHASSAEPVIVEEPYMTVTAHRPVYSVDATTSLDDGHFVTGHTDGTATVWMTQSGQGRDTLNPEGSGEGMLVTTVQFYGDGSTILTADSQVRLWDGTPFRSFGFPAVSSAAIASHAPPFSVATGSNVFFDGEVILWNGSTGEEIRRFSGHTGNVNAVTFSPDNSGILSGGDDNVARLWSLSTGQSLQFTGHTGRVVSVAMAEPWPEVQSTTPPGVSLVLTGAEDDTIRLWNSNDGNNPRRVFEVERPTGGITLPPFPHVAKFVPNKPYVVSGGGDGVARLWDTQTGREVRRFERGIPIMDIAVAVTWLTDEGHYFLITVGASEEIHIWSLFGPVSRPDLEWIWAKGSDTAGESGVYGEMGETSPDDKPGGRFGAVSWTDLDGMLWLLGGNGLASGSDEGNLNDLWRYNPETDRWTWMKGSRNADQHGVYGEEGISPGSGSPASEHTPGARSGAVSWRGPDGSLWLFGGNGRARAGEPEGYMNDLWRFDMDSGNWTWTAGSDRANQRGVYGTRGQPHPNNIPGARYGASSWTDDADNMWLFGGNGYDSLGDRGDLNDLWKFDPNTQEWTWVKGLDRRGQSGIYGALGDIPYASAINTPGARLDSATWTDGNGNLWLHGGWSMDESQTSIRWFNDLWMLYMPSGNWVWMGGSDTLSSPDNPLPGVYGTVNTPDPENIPGARSRAATWTDGRGDLWMFGGHGYDRNGNQGRLGDLWWYNIEEAQWTWMKGPFRVNENGVYTTMGESDPANYPGGRDSAIGWEDYKGNMWLFGGWGLDAAGALPLLSDLWRFEPPAGTPPKPEREPYLELTRENWLVTNYTDAFAPISMQETEGGLVLMTNAPNSFGFVETRSPIRSLDAELYQLTAALTPSGELNSGQSYPEFRLRVASPNGLVNQLWSDASTRAATGQRQVSLLFQPPEETEVNVAFDLLRFLDFMEAGYLLQSFDLRAIQASSVPVDPAIAAPLEIIPGNWEPMAFPTAFVPPAMEMADNALAIITMGTGTFGYWETTEFLGPLEPGIYQLRLQLLPILQIGAVSDALPDLRVRISSANGLVNQIMSAAAMDRSPVERELSVTFSATSEMNSFRVAIDLLDFRDNLGGGFDIVGLELYRLE